jgi:hypothetical protein
MSSPTKSIQSQIEQRKHPTPLSRNILANFHADIVVAVLRSQSISSIVVEVPTLAKFVDVFLLDNIGPMTPLPLLLETSPPLAKGLKPTMKYKYSANSGSTDVRTVVLTVRMIEGTG